MLVYKIETDGRATNLRGVSKDYTPAADEIVLDMEELPDIETLHTAAYIEKRAREETNLAVKESLYEIDLKSIRSLREWLAAQTDAPQFVKDYEAKAAAERLKLK